MSRHASDMHVYNCVIWWCLSWADSASMAHSWNVVGLVPSAHPYTNYCSCCHYRDSNYYHRHRMGGGEGVVALFSCVCLWTIWCTSRDSSPGSPTVLINMCSWPPVFNLLLLCVCAEYFILPLADLWVFGQPTTVPYSECYRHLMYGVKCVCYSQFH